MHYADTVEQATKIGQRALQRMAELGIAGNPENYSIWYGYFSGRFPDLTNAIDSMIANGEKFSVERNAELFRRFIGFDREGDAIHEAGERIRKAIGELLSMLESAGSDTSRYGKALETFTGEVRRADSFDQLRSALTAVVSETREMARRNDALQTRLATSTQEMEDMRRDLDKVRREAMTDGLTGIANRKYFDMELRAQAAEAGGARPLALLMIDIDHFKKFNDNHGHVAGDQVLKLVAKTMRDCLKGRDLPARYGGEEFSVILPETPLRDALTVAESIRKTVGSKKIVNRANNKQLGNITLSIGVAQLSPGEALTTLIQRADGALYRAKRSGRNRVEIDGNPAAAKAMELAG